LSAAAALIGLSLTFAQDIKSATTSKNSPTEDQVAHGTINIALANGNGFVILTDSMVTSGGRQLPDPAQKLFKLDDRTVCTIAGFLSGGAPAEEISTQTAAVIRQFIRALQGEPSPPSIETELRYLSFTLETRLTVLADVRQSLGANDKLNDYFLDLIIAGYDTDGFPKIGKVSLRAQLINGKFDSSVQTFDIKLVKDDLEHQAAGMPDLAEQLLANPEQEPQDAILRGYANSWNQGRGRSITIKQMTDLAADLAARTANGYPEVGGPNQIAILSGGRVVSVDQSQFPDPSTKVPPLSLLKNVGFHGQNAFGRPANETICVDCNFQNTQFSLDKSYVVATTFTNTVLTYDGGPIYFDKANQVYNCALVLGPNAKIPSLSVHDLVVNFPWAKVMRARTSSQSGAVP